MPKLDLVTKKTTWFTKLQEKAVHIDIPLVERINLPEWIAKLLATQQQNADQNTLELISDRVEGNLLAAYQEIQKLALLYPAGKISFEQCRENVSNVACYDIYKLSEAMIGGDTIRFVRIMSNLKNKGTALPLVLWKISDEIRTLLKLKLAVTRQCPISVLLKNYRIWGTRARLIETKLPSLSFAILEESLKDAAQVDKIIKNFPVRHSHGDAWDVLLQLGVRISQERN